MAIIRCPHCGTANREGANFCNRCGVELPTSAAEGSQDDSASPESLHEEPVQTSSEKVRPAESEQQTDLSSAQAQKDDEPGAAPWLNLDFLPEEDAPPFDREADEDVPPSEIARLLTSVHGLLAPVRITVTADEADEQTPRVEDESDNRVDLWRRVRTHMSTTPTLAGLSLPGARPAIPNLRQRWIFLVLALAIVIPAVSMFAWPFGSATQWPGVEEAFATVDGLPANANVLVYWAYDPATAGELDMEALAVSTHLFSKRAQISVLSLLPGAPATARRVLGRARIEWQRSENLAVTASSTWSIPIAFLPGGPSLLALVAQNPSFALAGINGVHEVPDERPQLAVVYAAQADDVQHWLEQVQPLMGTPVVAVVAAGADPVLRPYLESGQLSGLVSGFDGAYSYRKLMDEQDRQDRVQQLNMQLVLQDWGHFVFFLLIVIGNFAAIVRRSDVERPA